MSVSSDHKCNYPHNIVLILVLLTLKAHLGEVEYGSIGGKWH